MDLTVEQLHKIATSKVHPNFKVLWLQLWNGTDEERAAYRFPLDRPMKDKFLDAWLPRASLWAQVCQYFLPLGSSFLIRHNCLLF